MGVRGYPIINDTTIDEACAASLERLVPVIENGSDDPGTILDECSAEFKKCFEEADLIIFKG